MAAATLPTVTERGIRRLRRVEFDRLVALGTFDDERVELLHGQLFTMGPQGIAHAYSVQRLVAALIRELADVAQVRVHASVIASDESEPEPDIAVVDIGDYRDDHPATCHLVVEIADASRKTDLEVKARLYAEMGVPDYWVVDLQRRELVVHREPATDRYREVRTLAGGASIAVLAFPDVVIVVDDILPPG
jgi:Uma2 family endonuclease